MVDNSETQKARIENHIEHQAEIFSNRLLKRWRHLKKWARRTGVTCFRLYDRDIPEIPLAVDIYELEAENAEQGSSQNTSLYALLYFYEKKRRADFYDVKQNDAHDATRRQNRRRYARVCFANSPLEKSQYDGQPPYDATRRQNRRRYARVCFANSPLEKSQYDGQPPETWLSRMRGACAKTLAIDESRVIVKTRRHEKGGSQYADVSHESNATPAQTISGIVCENGLRFTVDLTDYIDTGLFLDMRLLRQIVRGEAKQKRVLNLYCYTGAFSVYAAEGEAALVDSVDLSNTYLARAKQNMRLNNFTDGAKYRFIKEDVAEFLRRNARRLEYDLIILDPPTFSNSKMTRGPLDLNKDWNALVNAALALLANGGVLYFSTNSRRLKFNAQFLKNADAQEITPRTIDEDFAKKRPHRVWRIVKAC